MSNEKQDSEFKSIQKGKQPDQKVVVNEKKTKKKKKEKKPPFTVAAGKSITTLAGTKNEGEEIKAEYFSNGQKDLERLIEKDVVDEN